MEGPLALSSWAQQWAAGTAAPWVARLWASALARPLFTANWQDLSPLLCSEALDNYSMGATVGASVKDLHVSQGME